MSEKWKTAIIWMVASVLTVAISILVAFGKIPVAAVLCLAPIVGLAVAKAFDDRMLSLSFILLADFSIPVLEHYINGMSIGLLMDFMIVFNIVVLACSSFNGIKSSNKITLDLLIAIGIWLMYCIVEVFNPNMRSIGVWLSAVRSMALYFFTVTIIVELAVTDFKKMMTILRIWSVFVIVAFIKVIYQKYVGWTPGDKFFLNVLDGKRTHLIYYGTRYFSIFSDAANFGGSMGMAVVVFAIAGLHGRNLGESIYFFSVAACACIGMFLSGTRSALPVPVAGIMAYLVLIKDYKKMIPIGVVCAVAVGVLAFTEIGQSNTYIRRARTVFHREEDLSYQVRKENQRALRGYMKELPFGNGLGMSAGRAQRNGDYSPLTYYPTDSWLVQLWVETGIVGLLLYLSIMGYVFCKGAYIIFFKLKNRRLAGICAGLLSGIMGLFVMSTNNEVFTQFPNSILVYVSIALIFISPQLETTMQEDE
ncbi:MAG: O-antigen ligase family protein [Candidatus Cryptobacteroides sp.]